MIESAVVHDITTILAVLSPLAALIFGYFSFNNTRKSIEKGDAQERTTLIVKLETINENIKDVKSDLKSVKEDLSSLAERLAKVESSVASAHHRIDEIHK